MNELPTNHPALAETERRPFEYPVYHLATDIDGRPCVNMETPDGAKPRTVAVMCNTDYGHELAETMVDHLMRGRVHL